MPTNEKTKAFATGRGAYTFAGLHVIVPTQSSSASANYLVTVAVVPPYVAGILPGRATSSKPLSGNTSGDYGIIRAVYLTATTTITGTGASGAGATANIKLYRAGASAVTVATLAFDTGVIATALTPKLITLSTTLANLYVRFSDTVVFQWLQGGTGLALPESNVTVDLI